MQLLANSLSRQAAPAAGPVACNYAALPVLQTEGRTGANSLVQTVKVTGKSICFAPGPGFAGAFPDPAHHVSCILMKTFLDGAECHGCSHSTDVSVPSALGPWSSLGYWASSSGTEQPFIPRSGRQEVNAKEGPPSRFLPHLLALLALFLFEETTRCFARG